MAAIAAAAIIFTVTRSEATVPPAKTFTEAEVSDMLVDAVKFGYAHGAAMKVEACSMRGI